MSETSSLPPSDFHPEPIGSMTKEEWLEKQVIDVLKTIFDPEIPVNIYELGLIYEIQIQAFSFVVVKMTLTAPACPVAGSLPGEVEAKIKSVPGVSDAQVDLVWEPAWNKDMMSEEAKLTLNMFW